MMNNEKPIRRYSKPRLFLMNTKYYSVMGLRIPIGLTLISLGFLASVTTLGIGLACLPFVNRSQTPGYVNVELFSGCLISDYILYCVIRTYNQLPQGHPLYPLPPEPNEMLPDAEVLVRASSVSDAAQKETLLRPAAAAADAEPQTLLRAVNGPAKD